MGLKDPKFDELYWNVNGNGWNFTMDTILGEIHYPSGAKLIQFHGYTGRSGETGSAFKTETLEDGILFTTTRAFDLGEGITVRVAWEKNHLIFTK